MIISDFMKETGTGFGTSGVRSLVTKLTDRVCYVYTLAFLQYLEEKGELKKGMSVAIAGDLRSSTDRIMRAVGKAVSDKGYAVQNMGKIPSPAIALYGIQRNIPAIMVTGSHIPDDRNGIKYNKPSGEVLKSDEQGIKVQDVTWDASLFGDDGLFLSSVDFSLPPADGTARTEFVKRYINFFPEKLLEGKRVGLYQHSAVGRDIFKEILEGLGAEVEAIGRSEKFMPVDTEAIRPEDKELAKAEAPKYFALVSTDGDSDRPLIAGRNGAWFRGDVLGILVSKFLSADAVATPVSCNTALEKSGWFENILRTRIGSPYVIAAMMEEVSKGAKCVVSYEANGGFLTANDVQMFGKKLTALPTRDAFLPILTVLWSAVHDNVGVSDYLDRLPKRFTASNRLKEFPRDKSAALLSQLNTGNYEKDKVTIEKMMGKLFGRVSTIDTTDGVRITFESGEIVHYRPSGNAPEFRCYTEADTEERAIEMNDQGLALARELADHI